MSEALIFLALIPLALGGAFILGIAVWKLLPVTMLLGGLGLALVKRSAPGLRYDAVWPLLVAGAGFFWMSARDK